MNKITVSAKTVEDALTEASIELGLASTDIDYEVIEKGSAGFLGIGAKQAVITAWKKVEEKPKKEKKSEKKVDKKVEKKVAEKVEEKPVEVKEVKETPVEEVEVPEKEEKLAEVEPQTKEACEKFLTDVLKSMDMEVKLTSERVKLDTENYRERRKETLENLAKNIAHKVKRTKRAVSLEPMNPYERRIIHSALQADKYISTHSEGEEPYRRVVVTLNRK